MKIMLLGFGKIAYMPYMNFYLDTLKDHKNIEFELIYWDRDGKPDADVPKCIGKTYKFEAHLEEQLPFKKKLKYFLRYRYFALKILRKNRYDAIVALHMTPGLVLLDYLRLHYKGKYIVDFRDISYEYVPIYRKLVGWLVSGSAITYVSSDAFRKFLPKSNNIYTVHNYIEDLLDYKMLRNAESRERSVLRISYWGLVRHLDVNKKIMDALGNDSRFELHYYGRMQQAGRDMEKYAIDKHYSNVFFHGQYMPEERYVFAKSSDFIHNLYDCDYTMGNAMSNKYYDGIIFGISQLCTNGSYMGEVVTKHNVGLSVDLDDRRMADKIWNYYHNIDWEQFEKDCDMALNDVVIEQKKAQKSLLEFLPDI